MTTSEVLGAIGIAALLVLPAGLAELLEVDDRSGESIAARDAIARERDQRRHDAAVRAMCADVAGENSVPVERPDGSTRCATKRGHVIKTLSHFPERRL